MEYGESEVPIVGVTEGLEDGQDNGEYGGNYAEVDSNYGMPANEFDLINSVMGDGIQKDKEIGITNVEFDAYEELLWMGTKSGHVTSYYGTQMQKYTSFQIHPTDEIRNILTIDSGILALTPNGLRHQMRRGIPLFTHTSDDMTDMHSLLFNQRTGRVLMGGLQEKLIDLDVGTKKQFQVINDVPDGSNAILREHGRFMVSGDASRGKVHLRDPLTLKVAHTLDAHSGILSDLDVHGHHLVTCGSHAAARAPDRFLMVYDLRILRAISPIQIMVVPYQLRFLPSMSSRIVVLSSMGQVQLVDTAAISTPQMSMFQVNNAMDGSTMTLTMDISPSNQCLAFGDTSNTLHLYSSVAEPMLNPYSRDSEFADPVETLPPMDINDELAIYSSVPRPHLPEGQTSYCSDYWPDRFNQQIYRPTPEIDQDILRTMKLVGNIGYARNTSNMKRNVVRYQNLKNKRAETASQRHGGDDADGGAGAGGPITSKGLSLIPKQYRKVAIKISKMGTDDFDFDRYNRTGFCGLEASLPNSYCNAMLQIMYFSEKLRILLLNHTCSRENCICCELSFIFHMMDISPGMPCQSSNFLRALRTIPEASALGLVFTDQGAVWNSNVPRLVQSWNRFILQQIHMQTLQSSTATNKSAATGSLAAMLDNNGSSSSTTSATATTNPEDMSRQISAAFDNPRSAEQADGDGDNDEADSLFSRLFGMIQEKVNVCSRCKESKSKKDTILLCNLSYPDSGSVLAPVPTSSATSSSTSTTQNTSSKEEKCCFEDIVCSSLCPEVTTPAWCDHCKKYQTTNQIRNLVTLPNVLSLNAGMDNVQDVEFWSTQMEYLWKEANPSEELEAAPVQESQQQPSTAPIGGVNAQGIKNCRYGLACTRGDCKFAHPEAEAAAIPTVPKTDIGIKCANQGLSWIPSSMKLNLHANGKVSYGVEKSDDEDEDDDKKNVTSSKDYELYGICWTILDPTTGQPLNIVATINVGPTYHARIASPVSQWYIFNDFSITTITPAEAIAVHPTWKVPCILFYQAKTMETAIREVKYSNPITSEVFLEDKSLAQRGGRKRITFIPLSSEEMPTKGDLVAIDAEFVTLNQEESELRSDGKVSTIKAAQMSVARITCVRGGTGPMEGRPFIDDYISTQEQVVDYVTKFSGIKPGDLDANYSSKHLTTLKSTYKKLRYLVDIGCVFIGHGLKNDFKVINIVVPPEQVIDTVLLFHLPHHRMVSLKFLAWHFLDKKIQGITHDSIEDAVTALLLYKKYQQLKGNDTLIEALNGLYEKGKACNWKIPEDDEVTA